MHYECCFWVYQRKERCNVSISIYPIQLGVDHCYIIQGRECIMIDGGAPNQIDKFKKRLSALPLKPQDIRLILLTHGHWDHIGSVRDIKEYTGAQLALHKREKDRKSTRLNSSHIPLPRRPSSA